MEEGELVGFQPQRRPKRPSGRRTKAEEVVNSKKYKEWKIHMLNNDRLVEADLLRREIYRTVCGRNQKPDELREEVKSRYTDLVSKV